MNLHVKVKSERDEYGFGIYEVKGQNPMEYLLVHSDPKVPKQGFKLFKAHCYRDRETMLLDSKSRKDAAEKILSKPKRKR